MSAETLQSTASIYGDLQLIHRVTELPYDSLAEKYTYYDGLRESGTLLPRTKEDVTRIMSHFLFELCMRQTRDES